MSGTLIIRASSPGSAKRVKLAWDNFEPRLPREVRDYIVRTTMVHVVDIGSHWAFVIGAPGSPILTPIAELVLERQAQTGSPRTDDPHFMITLALGHESPLRPLAHECAHVWRGDPLREGYTQEEEDQVERETQALADQWLARPPSWETA